MDRETCLCCYIWKLGFKARPLCMHSIKDSTENSVFELKSCFRTETLDRMKCSFRIINQIESQINSNKL